MKKKVDEKWVEAIAHCSVSLHGGEARRFVRRHARLVKDTSYNPYTYVEVELTVPWLEWSDDECTLNETTLMVPGFAQCMHMDQFNEHMGIVQAWVKAYEDLVKIVEKYRTVPGACPDKERDCAKRQVSISEMGGACVGQLVQIFHGSVGDGDLMSKTARDTLVDAGLVMRMAGYNIITAAGARQWLDMRETPDPDSGDSRGCGPVPIVLVEDNQNEGVPRGQCRIGLEGCCAKEEE